MAQACLASWNLPRRPPLPPEPRSHLAWRTTVLYSLPHHMLHKRSCKMTMAAVTLSSVAPRMPRGEHAWRVAECSGRVRQRQAQGQRQRQ